VDAPKGKHSRRDRRRMGKRAFERAVREDIARIAELDEKGMSPADIAKTVRWDEAGVRAILRVPAKAAKEEAATEGGGG
jgi:DNA-binding transcriptional MerR regulator